jgi:hypothetical protein
MELKVNTKRGAITILYDDCDHELVGKYNWYTQSDGYAYGRLKTKLKKGVRNRKVLMHRLILGILDTPALQGDHINFNKTDNRRVNLRTCTLVENLIHRKRKNTKGRSSIYIGVSWHKATNKWQSSLGINNKMLHLGIYDNEVDAAKARDESAKIHHGKFANLNFK